MKKSFKTITILGAFSFFTLLLSVNLADATVGGPTYIHTFKYNPNDESVYYVKNSHDGRGCPPVLVRISLATAQSQVVYSCEQGEKIYQEKDSTTAALQIRNEINAVISGFKDLTPINLKKNNIAVDVQFVRSEKLSPELDEIKNSIFNATIYQDGKKITEMPLSGCSIEQPFTFAGYAIPGFDKKIMLLVSAKGDCFEGGYTGESLLVLGGLEYVNKDYLNFYKDEGALVPNEGTLTVYENDTVGNTTSNDPIGLPTEKEETPTRTSAAMILGATMISLLIGFLIGRITKRHAQNL